MTLNINLMLKNLFINSIHFFNSFLPLKLEYIFLTQYKKLEYLLSQKSVRDYVDII